MNVHAAARLAGFVLAAPIHSHRVLVSRPDRLVIQVTTAEGRFVLKLEGAGDGLTRELAARTFLRARCSPGCMPCPASDPHRSSRPGTPGCWAGYGTR
ncbi:hypothetical protein [Deinococcus sedimenti]|uniref:Uncharacterized protein n=1 Tax=Deinococcus sedimenti TaxID=1867090 RepID=A0ABQ2S6Q2_9DEIO|nr:hypothetical protein [Deinococcus sedimenti]GGR94639.1 hypothetical protein GCM10008960_22000 [Deinococcus sedimenti]